MNDELAMLAAINTILDGDEVLLPLDTRRTAMLHYQRVLAERYQPPFVPCAPRNCLLWWYECIGERSGAAPVLFHR